MRAPRPLLGSSSGGLLSAESFGQLARPVLDRRGRQAFGVADLSRLRPGHGVLHCNSSSVVGLGPACSDVGGDKGFGYASALDVDGSVLTQHVSMSGTLLAAVGFPVVSRAATVTLLLP